MEVLWLHEEEETRRLAEEVVQALSEGEEEGDGGSSRTGGGHRRGKKRTHKSYYEMTEKERFVYIRKFLSLNTYRSGLLDYISVGKGWDAAFHHSGAGSSAFLTPGSGDPGCKRNRIRDEHL